jgi:cyclic pyranopterin phosphate synthase
LQGGLRVKVNVVALKGINDDELPGFVDFARLNGLDVRFIEFMPIGYKSRWSRDNYWPAEDIIAEVEKLVPLEEVLEASRNSGPARMYGISGGSGRIGVISAVSNHFCESCNRFRVTSDGKLRTCLFSDREYDVRSILRDPGHTMQDLLDLFARANAEKPMGYKLLQDRERNQVCDRAMTAIGG